MEPAGSPSSEIGPEGCCGCISEEDVKCGCATGSVLVSQSIEPEHYMKVIDHKVRQKILIALSYMTMEEPVSIIDLSEELGLGYHQLNYQLKNHLIPYWITRYEKKVRGAHQIFISPPHQDVIYFLLGAKSHLHIIDPLAGRFGKLSKVGTRCDECPPKQVQACLGCIKENPCMPQSTHLIEYRKSILLANSRPIPHMPIDYFLVCTVMKNLTQEVCMINLRCKEAYTRYSNNRLKKEE